MSLLSSAFEINSILPLWSLTILLTIKIYEKNNFKFYEHDYVNFNTNFTVFIFFYNFLRENKIIDSEIFTTEHPLYLKIIDKKCIFFREKNIKELLDLIYKNILEGGNDKRDIIKVYLYITNEEKISYTSKLKNMSFQDIIYNSYNQLQIGYTGTANINLHNNMLNLDDQDYVFTKINLDPDEEIEVNLALYQYSNPNLGAEIDFLCVIVT